MIFHPGKAFLPAEIEIYEWVAVDFPMFLGLPHADDFVGADADPDFYRFGRESLARLESHEPPDGLRDDVNLIVTGALSSSHALTTFIAFDVKGGCG